MTIKNNKEKTMLDRAEEIQKRYNLPELPDELVEVDPADLPIEADYGGLGERSARAAYLARRPWLQVKPAEKPILKNLGAEVAPGVRAGEILERLQHQVEELSKSVEDTDQKIGDLLLKANKCADRACRQFGKLHIHLNEGGN